MAPNKKNSKVDCCSEDNKHTIAPDHTKEIHRLNRIAGQLNAVKRMITEREYCPDIIIQIQAVRSALRSLESVLLERHVTMCVQDALLSKNKKDADHKIEELIELFRRS